MSEGHMAVPLSHRISGLLYYICPGRLNQRKLHFQAIQHCWKALGYLATLKLEKGRDNHPEELGQVYGEWHMSACTANFQNKIEKEQIESQAGKPPDVTALFWMV